MKKATILKIVFQVMAFLFYFCAQATNPIEPTAFPSLKTLSFCTIAKSRQLDVLEKTIDTQTYQIILATAQREVYETVEHLRNSPEGLDQKGIFDQYNKDVPYRMRYTSPLNPETIRLHINLQRDISPQFRFILKLYHRIALGDDFTRSLAIDHINNHNSEDLINRRHKVPLRGEAKLLNALFAKPLDFHFNLDNYVLLNDILFLSPLFLSQNYISVTFDSPRFTRLPHLLVEKTSITQIILLKADLSADDSMTILLEHPDFLKNLTEIELKQCSLPKNFCNILKQMTRLEFLFLEETTLPFDINDLVNCVPIEIKYLTLRKMFSVQIPASLLQPRFPNIKALRLRHNSVINFPESLQGLPRDPYTGEDYSFSRMKCDI